MERGNRCNILSELWEELNSLLQLQIFQTGRIMFATGNKTELDRDAGCCHQKLNFHAIEVTANLTRNVWVLRNVIPKS